MVQYCVYIGKIDKSDWNIKEIERKIQENKVQSKHNKNGTEKVPKWSRPQFDDKVLFYNLFKYLTEIIYYIYIYFIRLAQLRKNFM